MDCFQTLLQFQLTPLLRGQDGGHRSHHLAAQGKAVQVDPIKPNLKAPGTNRLRLNYEKLLPSFAFNLSLRRYAKERATELLQEVSGRPAILEAVYKYWTEKRKRTVGRCSLTL
jgi:hypothetical protein